MALIAEYLKLQKEYESKYGDRTILFMQVGSFYEMYATSEGEELISGISEILGAMLTYKSRDDYNTRGTPKNPYMLGFPNSELVYTKNEMLLLNNNYTIIVYDQCKEDKTRRELKHIKSPLTVNNITQRENIHNTNQIMTIYIEVIANHSSSTELSIKNFSKLDLLVGLSHIDVSTGKNVVREIYSKREDYKYAINELYRILATCKPKELQFYINVGIFNISQDLFEKYIIETLELNSYPLLNISFDIKKEYLLSSYQEQFLNLVFKKETPDKQPKSDNTIFLNRGGIINIFIELGLERLKYGTISYMLLIQYCYSHNPILFSKIRKPIIDLDDNEERLLLEHNSIIQLNLIKSNISRVNYRINTKKRFDTLLSIVGNCSTSMAKRTIRDKILSPTTNIKVLREKYDIIEYLREQDEYRNNCSYKLKELYDIEKLNFKLLRGNLTPKEFHNLFTSYSIVIELLNSSIPHIYNSENGNLKALFNIFPKSHELTALNNCIKDVCETFNLNILEECNIIDQALNCKNCPIIIGKYPQFDNYQQTISNCSQRLESICSHLEKIIGGSNAGIEIGSYAKKKKKAQNADDEEDEEIINMKDLAIYLTQAKVNKLKNNLNQVNIELCGDLVFDTKNKKYKVTSNIIEYLCNQILQNRNKLAVELYSFYTKYLDYINNKYDMTSVIKFIIDLDIGITNANNSLKFNYHKPIISGNAEQSTLKVKNLRHPLVERIISSEYISNDIELNTDNHNGMLIYGCNSTGKTTLSTSTAWLIVMAQAEMWTAGQLEYYPYTKIITRLSGQDDMEKGHSSFVVEMLELRTILRNSNTRTLVIGDELCRGTESLSGSALTIGTLEELCNRNVSFIFSTHLHDIPNKKRVKDLVMNKKLNISHLESLYDEVTGELIYNRKLKNGPGESIYGLEVAKSLDINPNFISNVELIRKELLNEPMDLLSTKKAKYNSDYFRAPCIICGSYDMEINQTHHIKEQTEADVRGFIGDMHKNSINNLTSLCKNCHIDYHSGNVKIETITTPKGTYLVFKKK